MNKFKDLHAKKGEGGFPASALMSSNNPYAQPTPTNSGNPYQQQQGKLTASFQAAAILFLKAILGIFSSKHYNFYNKYKWQKVHPIYSAGIRTHSLQHMSLLP